MSFRFEKLEIWKEAIAYTKDIYIITKQFPREELFSLTDQLKRASNSIAANIAEGSGSTSTKDFIHSLNISIKSCYETVSHLYMAKELAYIKEFEYKILYDKAELLSKKIRAFKVSLLR